MGPTQLTGTPDAYSVRPAVAAMKDSAIIVWDEEIELEIYDIYYTVIDNVGNTQPGFPAAITEWEFDNTDADVAVDADGNLVVVWEQGSRETEQDEDDAQGWVAYALLDPQGNILETDIHLTEIVGSSIHDADLDGREGRRYVAAIPELTKLPQGQLVGGVITPISILAIIPWIILAAGYNNWLFTN